MISGSIARRYAKALLAIGVKSKILENLGAEIEQFSALAENKELRETLANPSYSLSKRKAIVEQLIARLKLSRVVHNFLQLLMDRNRLSALPDIVREFQQMVDKHMGQVRANVTSAVELNTANVTRLKQALERKTGKNIILELKTDPSLIAGMVTQIGSIVYDGSIRTRLEQMRQTLLKGEQ